MESLPVFQSFGRPVDRMITSDGEMALWSSIPFLVTRVEGHATSEMGVVMEAFFKDHFPKIEFLVTIHDWSHLSGYDSDCRRRIQLLANFMRSKQHELLIHLGPAASIGQRAVRVTAETISKLKGLPIELFSSDDAFDARVRVLLLKYAANHQRRSILP
jgi:hypothetical protein